MRLDSRVFVTQKNMTKVDRVHFVLRNEAAFFVGSLTPDTRRGDTIDTPQNGQFYRHPLFGPTSTFLHPAVPDRATLTGLPPDRTAYPMDIYRGVL